MSNAKLEQVRERSWSLILPQLRLFQRTIPGTFSRLFPRSISESILGSNSRTLSRTRVCVLGIVLRSHKSRRDPGGRETIQLTK